MAQADIKKPVVAIVACTQDGGIGKEGKLPWKLSGDMAYFKRVTLDTEDTPDVRNAVIMGRKTWESIPKSFRPLPGRLNVVLSRSPTTLNLPEGVVVRFTCSDVSFPSLSYTVAKILIFLVYRLLNLFPARCNF